MVLDTSPGLTWMNSTVLPIAAHGWVAVVTNVILWLLLMAFCLARARMSIEWQSLCIVSLSSTL